MYLPLTLTWSKRWTGFEKLGPNGIETAAGQIHNNLKPRPVCTDLIGQG